MKKLLVLLLTVAVSLAFAAETGDTKTAKPAKKTAAKSQARPIRHGDYGMKIATTPTPRFKMVESGKKSWWQSRLEGKILQAKKQGKKVQIVLVGDSITHRWEVKDAREAFKDTLVHEKKVTSLITALYELAIEEKDYPAQNMLKWFIDEQVEEEESAQEIIDQLDAVEDNKYGLLMIDKDLATRVYNVPAPLQKGE